MSRDLKILLLISALVGAVGGYAVTRWGISGALGAAVLALVLGALQRKGWK